MTRWKAASIHLLITVAILVAAALTMILLWYGWPLFRVMGGLKLWLMLAATVLAIGPLMTLLVFKPGKRSLVSDLVVIVLLQTGLLVYGLYATTQARPVFIVGLADRFDLVHAGDLDPVDLAKGTMPEYRTLSWTGPRLVGGQLGRNSKERFELAMSGWNGKDINLLPERYVPFAEVREVLRPKMAPAAELAATSPDAKRTIERFAAEAGMTIDELATLAIVSPRGRATMMMRASDASVLGPVPVEPWPDLAPPDDAQRQ